MMDDQKGAPEVIVAKQEQVGLKAVEWLKANRPDAKLILVEGMQRAGKSRAIAVIRAFWRGDIQVVELDELLPLGSLAAEESWVEGVLRLGAEAAIREALDGPGPALIEGPGAWQVLEHIGLETLPPPVRINIRRVQEFGGKTFWFAASDREALSHMPRPPALAALDDYHIDRRPDLDADLIIERTGEDD